VQRVSTDSVYVNWRITALRRFIREKLVVTDLVKKSPEFYGTQRFITVFRRTYHMSLFWARLIPYTPTHAVPLIYILILSSHVGVLCLPSGLCPSAFPNKIVCVFVPRTCHMLGPSHLTWYDQPNIRWRLQATKLLIVLFSPVCGHFLPLSPKYLLQHPILECAQLTSFPYCRRPSCTPYKTEGTVTVLCICYCPSVLAIVCRY
jgi:hypothetical protein